MLFNHVTRNKATLNYYVLILKPGNIHVEENVRDAIRRRVKKLLKKIS